MLHILMHSPFQNNYNLLIEILKKNDEILLLQDAVLIACNKNKILFEFFKKKTVVYAIKRDITARGINKYISNKIIKIEYIKFVKLVIKNSKQITW